MQELEKILEEIKVSSVYAKTRDGYGALCVPIGTIERIIRKHINDDWIPVEEWMPKENGIYLVTCDDTKFPVKRMRYKKDVEPNGLLYDVYGIYDGKVYAWQPLPDPYRPERREENEHKAEKETIQKTVWT